MRIFTDPHLGLNRKANTTPKSRVRLADAMATAAMAAAASGDPRTVVCAGDLFDKFSNPEKSIIDGYIISKLCDVVLAGNHDSLNEKDTIGSLIVVEALCDNTDVIICPEFNVPFVMYGNLEGMDLAFIPHHASQESFDSAVEMVINVKAQPLRAVFLHCNYENPMTEGSDTALNLTKAQAYSLLNRCDYVFLGHEHEPRQLLDGRLIILGNTHPTSFSDISNKFYYDLSKDTLAHTKIWSMKEKFAQLKYDGKTFPKIPEATILDITGEITMEQGVDLAEYVRGCWEDPNRLMVRNNVSIVSESQGILEAMDFDRLPDEIERELKGTPLEEKWLHYRGIVEC